MWKTFIWINYKLAGERRAFTKVRKMPKKKSNFTVPFPTNERKSRGFEWQKCAVCVCVSQACSLVILASVSAPPWCEILQQSFWLQCKHTRLTCEVTRVSPHFRALWLSGYGLRANAGTCNGADMSLLRKRADVASFITRFVLLLLDSARKRDRGGGTEWKYQCGTQTLQK